MSWSGKSVLVTGGAGFIGSHLTEALVDAGAKVMVVDSKSELLPPHIASAVDIIRQDVRLIRGGRWGSFEDFDVIFHLAANAYVPPSVDDPLFDYENNCTSTLKLLDELRAQQWKGRLVFASSAAVYGNPIQIPIHEDHPTVPVSPYGCGKLAAERYCSVFAKLYGLNIVSLRLFSVYGPRQRKQVVYDLMCKIRDGGPLHIHGDGTQARDFIYVDDAVQAALLVACQGRDEVYNVASGSEVTIHDLATQLCVLMGADPEFDYTLQNRPGDPEKLSVDVRRLLALGYEQVEFEDGLAATVDWFRSQ